jgi:hypothetical protein
VPGLPTRHLGFKRFQLCPQPVDFPRQRDAPYLWRTEDSTALPALDVTRDCCAGKDARETLFHR